MQRTIGRCTKEVPHPAQAAPLQGAVGVGRWALRFPRTIPPSHLCRESRPDVPVRDALPSSPTRLDHGMLGILTRNHPDRRMGRSADGSAARS